MRKVISVERGEWMEEEQVKKGFWKKLQESKWKQVCFFVGCMGVLVCIYSILTPLFHQRKISQLEIVEDDFSWVYQIDSMEVFYEKLRIDGWAFKLNKDAIPETCEIVLCEQETGNMYFPNISYQIRNDVNEYFLCEYDYSESGFHATISTKKLDMENGIYEVLLRTEKQQKLYATGIYFANGEMTFTNPKEFEALETVGTDLEEITGEGVLRVYRPDVGMYVYQYEGALYWIAEPWYEFVEKDIYVQFQMETTQISKLPKDRLDSGWEWSNLGFYFTNNELSNWNTGKYRVALYALPTEYSITKIWTGKHSTSGWLWKNDFRPWYNFDKE